MLKSETVLVLGAGASCNLGFPTGPKLLKQIADALDIRQPYSGPAGDPEIRAAFGRISGSGSSELLIRAGHRIRDAAEVGADNGNSIDNIIYQHEGNEQVSVVAKIAISKLILEAEAACIESAGNPKIADIRLRESWYPMFASLVSLGINPASLPNIFARLSVINFNYDRSFEYYLPFSLAATFGISLVEAEKITASLRIFHPYGSLGLLPWQTGQKQKINFGQRDVRPEELASGIRTFTEQMTSDGEIQEWRELVHQAQKLVFIGFGFHDQNLDLLEPKAAEGPSNVGRVIGTTFEMPEPQRAMVHDRILDFTDRVGRVELPNLPAKEFLYQFGHPIMS